MSLTKNLAIMLQQNLILKRMVVKCNNVLNSQAKIVTIDVSFSLANDFNQTWH
jgi:hypothetical protein